MLPPPGRRCLLRAGPDCHSRNGKGCWPAQSRLRSAVVPLADACGCALASVVHHRAYGRVLPWPPAPPRGGPSGECSRSLGHRHSCPKRIRLMLFWPARTGASSAADAVILRPAGAAPAPPSCDVAARLTLRSSRPAKPRPIGRPVCRLVPSQNLRPRVRRAWKDLRQGQWEAGPAGNGPRHSFQV